MSIVLYQRAKKKKMEGKARYGDEIPNFSLFFCKISSFPLQRGANCIYGLVEPPTLERPFYINFFLYLYLFISFFFFCFPLLFPVLIFSPSHSYGFTMLL